MNLSLDELEKYDRKTFEQIQLDCSQASVFGDWIVGGRIKQKIKERGWSYSTEYQSKRQIKDKLFEVPKGKFAAWIWHPMKPDQVSDPRHNETGEFVFGDSEEEAILKAYIQAMKYYLD